MRKENTSRLQEWQAELVKNNNKTYDQDYEITVLKEFVGECPEEITLLLCEGLLQKGELQRNPFARYLKHGILRYFNADLARIIVNKINAGRKDCGDKENYIPVTQHIEKYFYLDERNIQELVNDERYLPKIIRGFFKSYEATFGNSIGHVSYNVYRGLPLYKKNQLDKFVAITESDYDFIYIFMKGHYRCILGYTEEGRSSFPGWVEKYYVKNDHIVKFDEYFDERNYVHDDDRTIQLKRTDFRKFIGEKDVSINTDEINESLPNETFFHGDHDTKLMRIQKEVLNRYYGNQFDVTDRGTWSKQSDVVAWVRQEYNLTEREAMAVDMVTRPDQARGK